jgi:hypothetical protein
LNADGYLEFIRKIHLIYFSNSLQSCCSSPSAIIAHGNAFVYSCGCLAASRSLIRLSVDKRLGSVQVEFFTQQDDP